MNTIVTCQSGVKGWQGRLQDQYDLFEYFEAYSLIYGLHTRLGYDSPKEAWEDNPVVQGSVIPSDYRKVV